MTEHTGLAAKLKELGEKATPGEWLAQKGAGWLITRPGAAKRHEGAMLVGMRAETSLIDAPKGDEQEAAANAALIVALVNNLSAIIAALEARPPATEGNPDEEVSAIERVAHKGGRDAFVQGHDRDVPHNYSKHGLSKLWLNGWDHEKALSAARPSREEG